MNNYICNLRVLLQDHRYCKSNVVSTNYMDILSNNIICIEDVRTAPSANNLEIDVQCSIELDPALCFIWFGNQEYDIYGIDPKESKICISHTRKTSGFKDTEIRIKLWVPKICSYEYKYPSSPHTIKFSEMNGAKQIPAAYERIGIDEVD